MTTLKFQIKVGNEFRTIEMGTPLDLTISSKLCGTVFFGMDCITVCLGKNDVVDIEFGEGWYSIDLIISNGEN